MRVLKGLTIDNGGSEVRYKPEADGERKTLVNDFAIVNREKFRVKEVEDKLSVCDIVSGPEDLCEMIAYGMSTRQFPSESIGMRSGERKTNSKSYYLQFIYTVARDAMENYLAEERKVSDVSHVNDISEVGKIAEQTDLIYDYVITTLIPLREHSGDTDCVSNMKNRLKGDYEVVFPLITEGVNKVRFTIDPSKLGVLPEDGSAMVGLKKVVDPNDYSLVIGLGHVTLDLGVYRGTQLAGPVKSEPHAGSTLISLIKDALNDEGHYVEEDMVGEIIKTGKVKNGTKLEDVSTIISEQKKIFVQRYIKDDIIAVLNSSKLNPRQIQNIVPTGALFNESENTASMIKLVVEANGFENAQVQKVSDDLRYVNLEMAAKFTKALYTKLSK